MKGINGKGNNHGVEPGNGMALSNISIHHNFLVNNFARNPALSGNGPIELVNNLIYNYAAFGTQIQNRGGGTRLNIIGNYYKAGPDTFANRYALLVDQAMIYDVGTYSLEQTSESMYVHDNLSPQRTASSQPEWNVVGYCASTGVYCTAAAPSSFQRTTPWPSSRFPITISSAANVPAIVLSGVGQIYPAAIPQTHVLSVNINRIRAVSTPTTTGLFWPTVQHLRIVTRTEYQTRGRSPTA